MSMFSISFALLLTLL